MMHKNRPRSSSLFLMELILAILFFSIASAVCVQFFVKSHLLSHDSNALNHAANECAGAAEIIEAADDITDSIEMFRRLYPNGAYSDNQLVIYYDDTFSACNESNAFYFLTVHIEKSGQMLTADMQFTEDANIIYELSTKHHIARRTKYEKR